MKQTGRTTAGVIVASSMLLFAGSVLAEGREDYYTQTNQQRYFNMPENARTVGMAGSSVVTSSDSSSVIGNPAGLGFMKDAEISASYTRDQVSGNDAANYAEIQEDIDEGHALVALPIVPTLDGTPKYGTIGFGWLGEKTTADDVADTDGRGYGLQLAYGKDISDTTALGYSAGFVHKKITSTGVLGSQAADFSAKMNDGVVQTVGFQNKLSKATTLGLSTSYGFGSYENEATTGSNSIQGDDEDVRSWGIEGGMSHQMGATLLAFSTDYTGYNSNRDDDSFGWGFRTGVEQSFTDWLKGRLGYRYQANFDYDKGFENNNNKYNGIAFGVGVKLMKNLFADYGAEFRWVGDGSDWTHTVSLSVPFSLCKD